MGGIDRLNDAIFETMNARPALGFECVRLVTRGKGGLLLAQGVFAIALARFFASAWRGKVDLLHIHLSDRGSGYRKALLGIVARRLRVPYVVHLHGVYLREFWARPEPLLKRQLKRLFAGSAQVIVLGRYWHDAVLEGVPGISSRITVLPNATPAQPIRSAPQPSNEPVHITFLGQLCARKGLPELIRALGRLANNRDWSATLAGDGDLEAAKAQIGREGIAERVEIPGWLHASARTNLLARSDILALPSHAENLPMVILEAFSHGVPVIATPVGAVAEVITDGHNGILVPPGDDATLTRAIERLVVDANLRKSLGAAAKDTHSERFEFEKYICRLADLWRRACASA